MYIKIDIIILSNFIWHGFTIIVRAFSIALMLTVFPVQTSVFLLGKSNLSKDVILIRSIELTVTYRLIMFIEY